MRFVAVGAWACAAAFASVFIGVGRAQNGVLDPRGTIHIPIGLADTLDTLKTFVEAEGNFSPGFASYGIYFWVFDRQTGRLTAPTMEGVKCERGLTGTGYLIPWCSWSAADMAVKTEVCEVPRKSPAGEVFVVGARVHLANSGSGERGVSLYAALRPLGAAGWAVNDLAVTDDQRALLVDGRAALVSNEKATSAGVSDADDIGNFALACEIPPNRTAVSATGDCSGALRFDLRIAPGGTRTLGFICPVLPGRRAVRHQWDGKSTWAQLDEALPNPSTGGLVQPDPGPGHYLQLKPDDLFEQAAAYWKDLLSRATLNVPDTRWVECFAATVGHLALCLNEGAPDVAVVNYNVFNRDGVYVVNVLQKSGNFALAARAISHFLEHPFSGRVYPEADNPGQILWVMGEHWLFTRDRAWLERVYPSVKKLAAMIQYCRTTEGPHWVSANTLEFGDALPVEERQELKPGRCDGYHPEYTEAFDIAGLRKAVLLAEALGDAPSSAAWNKLADSLFETYDQRFGSRLPREYGGYCVLWPCRIYPLTEGKGHEQFMGIGAKSPGGWRYFPLAAAHQGLLAGSRQAGYATIQAHLSHEQMQGWYAFDEGGKSGPGGWRHVRTTWNHNVAMPHSWAIAELWLLLRDCLIFEDGDRLVLLAGIPPEWFKSRQGMAIESFPTHFGACSFAYACEDNTASLTFSGQANPPGGFVLRVPPSFRVKLAVDGKLIDSSNNNHFSLPPGTRRVRLEFLGDASRSAIRLRPFFSPGEGGA